MGSTAVIIEMDQERDRKECIKLYQHSEVSNRAFAEWLLKHFQYSGAEVARWVGCEESKIQRLRRWARSGFKDDTPNPRKNRKPAPVPGESLKTQANFEDDPEPEEQDEYAADPSNTVWFIDRHIAGANAVRKVLKASTLTAVLKEEINSKIEELISKWKAVQRLL